MVTLSVTFRSFGWTEWVYVEFCCLRRYPPPNAACAPDDFEHASDHFFLKYNSFISKRLDCKNSCNIIILLKLILTISLTQCLNFPKCKKSLLYNWFELSSVVWYANLQSAVSPFCVVYFVLFGLCSQHICWRSQFICSTESPPAWTLFIVSP